METAGRILEALLTNDPVGLSIALAPIDDEPETEEERTSVAEAQAELARGEGTPAAVVFRRLGL